MLDFLLWFFLIFFALVLAVRYLVPLLLRRYARKMEKEFNAYTDEDELHRKKGKEGEVYIHHIPEEEQQPPAPSGEIEYTDFEDIIDKDPPDHNQNNRP
jgi:hypothetical protein